LRSVLLVSATFHLQFINISGLFAFALHILFLFAYSLSNERDSHLHLPNHHQLATSIPLAFPVLLRSEQA